MVLCTFCENITIEDIAVPLTNSPHTGNWTEPSGYDHQPSWEALLQSAECCELCFLIRDVGKTHGKLVDLDPEFDEVPDQIARRNASQRLKVMAFRPGYLGSPSESSDGLSLQGVLISNSQGLRIYLEIVADEDSPAAGSGDISGRPINEETASTHTFALIASWRKLCYDSHTRCYPVTGGDKGRPPQQTEPRLPSWVLFVGTADSGEVRLHISNGANARYAALSHRWGSRETVACTTTANLSCRICDIPLSDLSPLFLDAITVMRKLKLRYLWIDSLCILQDSREDWERESALMGDVFGNSEVTFSAVAAEDGHSGFLGPRDVFMVSTKYRKSKSMPSDGFMYFRRPKNRLTNVVQGAALNKRAWVIQERILAPRILTFAESQVFWECREMVAGEGGPQHSNMAHISRRIIANLQDLSLDRDNTSLRAEIFAAWRQLVYEAADAGLTFESDRLHAIAGLSRILQQELRTEYLYGTWIEDLTLEIDWFPQARNRTLFTCRLPSVPRAPSWCWSSLEGPIRFTHDDLKDSTVCFEILAGSLPVIVVDTETIIPSRGLEASWALNLRAHVSICKVTIDGVFWKGAEPPETVRREDEGWAGATKFGGLATLNEHGQLIGGSWFDLQPNESSLGHYSCMLLCEVTRPLRYGHGLLLRTNMRSSDAHRTYTRVGRVSLAAAGVDWLRQREIESMSLI